MQHRNKLQSFKGSAFLDHSQLNLPFGLVDAGVTTMQPGERKFGPGLQKDFIEIIWCVNGHGRITLYGRSYTVSEGDAFYYLEREDHELIADSSDWTTYWLCFKGPLAEPIMRSFKYPRHQHIAEPCPISIFHSIFSGNPQNDVIENGLICARVLEIIVRMNANRQLRLHPDNTTNQIILFIQDNLADPALNIDMVADAFNMPKSTIQKYFLRHMRGSLGEYIRNERFQKATALLQNTTLPVQEIARATGYSLLSSFSRLIRRGTGYSPQDLRQRAINLSPEIADAAPHRARP